MSKNVLIVESPAKSKTIKKYLGKDFTILASYGHIRDLLPKTGAVDPDNNFEMRYEIIDKNKKHVDAIVKALKKAENLYLATDPDREGEAIAWHLYELLKEKKALKDKGIYRVVFNEITKSAVQKAVANPREVSMELVNAQQARRALDYLVGFNLSPLLWKKIRRGLSAGRVQSPALRLIVEREEEINAFESKEYWSIEADLFKDIEFTAKLTHYKDDKLEQFSITNEKDAKKVQSDIEKLAEGKLSVQDVEKKQRKKNPAAPFITSTLQQEASRKIGFYAQKTMRTAQQLYEGVDVGEGTVGLITYMRTDSVSLSNDALTEIRGFIESKYGKEYVPDEPRVFKTKSKNAQEAHEAIRPTSVLRTPESIKSFLSPDQYKLYELIWKRAVACQMIPATINTVGINLTCGSGHVFRATGSTIAHPGFMSVYMEGLDDNQTDDSKEKLLPPLEKGEVVTLKQIRSEQHFTEPPPRYSEATLVKSLEEFGIGRPSTYATIISTLQQREYVTLEKKRFFPTDVGMIVKKFLTEYFNRYVDYEFTANLEDSLDSIARGENQWVPLLEEFWSKFHPLIEKIDSTVKRSDVTSEEIDEKCPECSKPLTIRLGRMGRFIGCSGYPECGFTKSVNEEEGKSANINEVVEGRKCPKCENDLVIKVGRYGKFIGCSQYPECKHIEPLEKPKDTGVTCPECKEGQILQRKSRYGKIFYSCSRYPDCKYAIWNEPVDEPCPKCNWPILSIKTTKRRGTEKVCPQKECDYAIPLGEDE